MPLFKPFEAPIWAAMFGFVLAVLLLTNPNCNRSKSAFNELTISCQRESVGDMLHYRWNRLEAIRARLQGVVDSIKLTALDTAAKTKACKPYIDSLALLHPVINNTRQELDQLEQYNHDTAISYYFKYFSIDRQKLDSALKHFQKDGTIRVLIKDSCPFLNPVVNRMPADLRIKKVTGERVMDFISRNPAAGYTLIICIGQMTLWFLLGALLFGQLEPVANKDWRNFLPCFITPLLVIGLFVWLFYLYLTDDYLIKDNYVIEGFNNRALGYAIPGYLLALFCFSVFIYAANKLKEYNDIYVAATNPTNPATDKTFLQRKALFDTSFLFSAIVLSVFILESGVLVHAINSMEAMRLYKFIANRSFVPSDSIYMIAVMHSILLFVFYLPLTLKYNSLEAVKAFKIANSAGAGSQTQKVASAIWGNLQPILITASPLIAGALQQLIELFFKE